MKKFLAAVIAAAMVFQSGISVFANTIPRVNLNGTKILLQDSPFTQDGVLYVPLRGLANNLGAEIAWDAASQTATFQQGQTTVKLKVGNTTAEVNGKPVDAGAAVIQKNGVTFIPLRFIVETIGGQATYDGETNTSSITYTMPTDGGQKYDFLGRLIRTTNLPANAGEWEYVLNAVPNEMYESPLLYDKMNWFIDPVEGEDYTRPINMRRLDDWATDSNYKNWQDLIEKDLNLRLNVDYRTVGESWSAPLMDLSYYGYGDDPNYNEFYPGMVADYIQYLKDNHIVIEGDYYVEPSMTYYSSGELMRVWVKFRIHSDVANEAYLFANTDYPVMFKTNTWYSGYADMSVGTNIGGSDGSNLKIINDNYLSKGNIKEVQ